MYMYRNLENGEEYLSVLHSSRYAAVLAIVHYVNWCRIG